MLYSVILKMLPGSPAFLPLYLFSTTDLWAAQLCALGGCERWDPGNDFQVSRYELQVWCAAQGSRKVTYVTSSSFFLPANSL